MNSARVFVSYRTKDPDRSLARELHRAIGNAGHKPFVAEEDIEWGEKWPHRIEEELQSCDYFLLLLSKGARESEMVIEEVRRARMIQQTRNDGLPHILPLRVGFDLNEPLSYDLDGYLGRIQQKSWESPTDTPRLIEELLRLFSAGAAPEETTKSSEPAIELRELPPLPVAPPELPAGQVSLASAYYVERTFPEFRDENAVYETILEDGALLRISAPRQMGKTSLMARINNLARERQYQIVSISLQLVDGKVFTNLDALVRWFCSIVGRSLRLQNRLDEWWDNNLTAKDICNNYFDEYLLPNTNTPIVLALDEVDRLFEHAEVVEEFLGLIRGWNEEAKNKKVWKNLRQIIVHSTECYLPLDINQSPFDNVGLTVKPPEFSRDEIKELASRHGLRWSTSELDDFCKMVGGHPYLVRVGLFYVSKGTPLAEFLRTAPTNDGKYSDHLRRQLWKLDHYPQLGNNLARAIASDGPVSMDDSETAFKLEGLGLIKREPSGDMVGRDLYRVHKDLYRKYFAGRLRTRV